MKQNSIKKHYVPVFALLLAIVMFFAAFSLSAVNTASADEAEDYSNWSEAVSISNAQFSGSGDALGAPSNWTGAAIGEADLHVVSGSMNVDSYAQNKDVYELSQFDTFKSASPTSPFGKNTSDANKELYFPETNRNVLLINAGKTPAAYGYTSDGITLNPNSYYKFKVWVKSGELSADGGAAFLINGLDEDPIGYTDINTQDKPEGAAPANMLGWYDYTIFVETSSFVSATASISLQLGDNQPGGMTKGYAMFDNVTGVQLSHKTFVSETSFLGDREMVVSYNDSTLLTGFDAASDVTVNEFNNVNRGIINGLLENNAYGFEGAFTTPFETVDKNVFVISSYNKAESAFKEGYGSVSVELPTIERFKNYRVSVWYYAQNVSGGNGVNAKLKYKSVVNPGTEDSDYKTDEATSLSMSNANPNHNGWNELSIFVKGSSFTDYTAELELGLGTEASPAKGVVLYDEVRFEEITPTEYANNSANASKSVDFSSAISDSTGINNSSFNAVGTYTEELEYAGGALVNPLTPANWTFYTAETVATDGYATMTVPTDNAVYGIIPVEDMEKVGFTADKNYGNVLKMSSTEDTAFCYRSEEFKAAASSFNALSVKLNADDLSGYGANLVLKKSDKVIATIEKITKSGTYTFYVKGATTESTLKLELWLGLNVRNGVNENKKASGTVYFTEVKLATDSTEDVFNEKATAYATLRAQKSVREGVSFATVNLGAEDFTLFDSYTDGTVKYPYNWTSTNGGGTVRYGIFDATNREDSVIAPTYKNGDKQYAVVLQNVSPTYSTMTLANSYTLEADKYYTVKVTAKVQFPDDYYTVEDGERTFNKPVGAYIVLTNGDDHKFSITSTATTVDSIVDNETFETFTFHIKAPSASANTSITLGLGGEKTNEHVSGKIFVNDIVFEESSDIAFNGATEDAHTVLVDLSSASEDTDDDDTTAEVTTDSSLEWWLVPSILLAVAVLIAIVGSLIRNIIENRPKKVNKAKTASYDRRLVKDHKADKKADDGAVEVDDNFESFNDEPVSATEVETEEVTAEAETAAEEVAVESETTETAETEEATETPAEEITEEAAEETDKEEVAEEATEVTEPEEKPETKSGKRGFVDSFDD